MSGEATTPRSDDVTLTGRVPVEHRWFGLDRRSLLPGLVVVGLIVLWTVLVPFVNDQLEYSQQTKAGDVFKLGAGLTMDAQAGWGVDKGLLTTDETASRAPGGPVILSSGGAAFSVVPGPFRGTPRELLKDIEKVDSAVASDAAYHVSGDVQTFHTNQGQRGVAQAYTTVDGTGVVSALVYGDTGLKITFTGSSATLQDEAEQAGKMIDSIRYDPSAAR